MSENPEIMVERRLVPIMPNLFKALRHFSEQARECATTGESLSSHPCHHYNTHLWVDALCINQDDIQERSQQVYALPFHISPITF